MNGILKRWPSILIHPSIRRGVLIAIVVLSMIPCGCRKKAASRAVPKANADAIQYAAEGDALIREYHLYGWRQAEALYQKAYDLAALEDLKEKLLLVRFLILTRQVDEDIPNSKADTVIMDLCAGGENQKDLCAIAQWYRGYKADRKPEISGGAIFKGRDALLETYVQSLLSSGSTQAELKTDMEGLSDEFMATPLYLYLYPWRLKAKDPAEIETAYPRFAEIFEYFGESFFQKKKYATARTYFRKAVEIIPDYTRAINGLANICFFALEDYDRALRYYQSALDQDPTNTAALFGVGASLHKLDRYEESNAALDRMLAEDLLQNKRLDSAGSRYYSGEGRYLKAYNHHLMRDPLKARELVDAARQFLPDSEEIIDLSGILYFQAKQLEEAREEFLKVIAKGNSNCNAQMHLGLIYRRLKQNAADRTPEDRNAKSSRSYQETGSLKDESGAKKALNYFLGACSCMELGIGNLKKQMDSVSSLDLEPNEKILLQDRLKFKLSEVRASCSSNIEQMILEASGESTSDNDRYLSLMKEILSRMRHQ